MAMDNFFDPLKQRADNRKKMDEDGMSDRDVYLQTRALSLINLRADPKAKSQFDQYMQSNKNQEFETGE